MLQTSKSQTLTLTDYDTNAADFDHFRQPSTIIADRLIAAFSSTKGPILSLGCGTGKYESLLSDKVVVVGLDRSTGMIQKAKERIDHVLFGDMTAIPFAKSSFSGVYMMQSLHHIGANLGITSIQRNEVRKLVIKDAVDKISNGTLFIVQRDPSQNQAVWFWKYFPNALKTKLIIQPKVAEIVAWLKKFGLVNVVAEPIQDPMIRGFFDPRAPLDPGFRRSFSEFSYVTPEEMQQGVEQLKLAIEDGSVDADIEYCKLRFAEIGGTVFIISGEKIEL
jgi:SAM-dependent methyltransferase